MSRHQGGYSDVPQEQGQMAYNDNNYGASYGNTSGGGNGYNGGNGYGGGGGGYSDEPQYKSGPGNDGCE
jgi:hypothetical protein